RLEEPFKGQAAPDVGDQGHPLIPALGGQTQLGKLRDQVGGHVVHHVKAQILQKGGRSALPCPGQARYNYKLHDGSSVSIPQSRTSGSSVTPLCSSTVCRTSSMVASTSASVAPPRLTTKPACFSDTAAAPTPLPLRPAPSIRAAA